MVVTLVMVLAIVVVIVGMVAVLGVNPGHCCDGGGGCAIDTGCHRGGGGGGGGCTINIVRACCHLRLRHGGGCTINTGVVVSVIVVAVPLTLVAIVVVGWLHH